MASTTTAHVALTSALRRMVDFDPNASPAAVLVDLDPATGSEGFPIRDYRRFVFGVFHSVGTGNVAVVEVIADTDDDLATTPTVVKAHALGSNPNAVGDTIWLEVDVEQIREVLAAATHVGIRIGLNTSTDECVVYFEALEAMFPRANLTADYVS